MNIAGKFEKVSKGAFIAAMESLHELNGLSIDDVYNSIILPQRATKGSAGYDFKSPIDFSLSMGESITIPTGIRVKIEEGWWLAILPRSGHGYKYRIQLDNTVGVIDSDYYNADNEGHIMIKITNDSKIEKTLSLKAGTGFAQGIFIPYGITFDDTCQGMRRGGFGSTDK